MNLLNKMLYIYFFIAVGVVVIIVYGIKLFLLRKYKRQIQEKPEEIKKKKKLSEIKVKVRASKTAEPEKELKGFSLLKSKSKLTLSHWKYWFIEKYFPSKCVLVNMELINGFHRLFIVIEKDGGFVFRGKKYIFDDDSKYYNMDAKLYVFDYHENITLPVKRKIPVTAIKKTIESTDEIDIEYAINPSTLQRFMTAKIAEGVMKGTMLDEFLRKLQMFIIVIMITVIVHLVLFLWASRILENINLPF